MQSHKKGVKHMKKAASQRDQANAQGRPFNEPIIPIPNPPATKVKVPIRLHQKIKETKDPVVGLRYVKEFITKSDPEMDPQYECELCGSKGIANGMFSHIMGHTHRKNLMKAKHPNDERYHDQTQKRCLEWAADRAENDRILSDLIKTTESDEEYPWPPGKAPWSIERGGSGVAPKNAKENYGRNKIKGEAKYDPKTEEQSSLGGLPIPESIKAPQTQDQAARMLMTAENLILKAAGSLSVSSQTQVKCLTTCLLVKIRKESNIPTSVPKLDRVKNENGRHSPRAGPSNGHGVKRKVEKMERNSRSSSTSPQRSRSRRRDSSPRGGGYSPADRLGNGRYSSRGYSSSSRNGRFSATRDSPGRGGDYQSRSTYPSNRDRSRDQSPPNTSRRR